MSSAHSDWVVSAQPHGAEGEEGPPSRSGRGRPLDLRGVLLCLESHCCHMDPPPPPPSHQPSRQISIQCEGRHLTVGAVCYDDDDDDDDDDDYDEPGPSHAFKSAFSASVRRDTVQCAYIKAPTSYKA